MKRSPDYALYLVIDQQQLGSRSLESVVEEGIRSGVTMVQLRDKTASTQDFIAEARTVQAICRRYQIPFIINDRVDIALAIDADGVHLGQDDLPLSAARKLMGSKLIGISVHNLEEAEAAQQEGADYLAAGALFPTTTKSDATYISLSTLRAIVSTSPLPVIAIGGINQGNVQQVWDQGVAGIAVVSAILQAQEIDKACQQLLPQQFQSK